MLKARSILLVLLMAAFSVGCGDTPSVVSVGSDTDSSTMNPNRLAELDSIAAPEGAPVGSAEGFVPLLKDQLYVVPCEDLPTQVQRGVEGVSAGTTLSATCIVVRNFPGSAEQLLSRAEWEAGLLLTPQPFTDAQLEAETIRDLTRSGGGLILMRPAGAWATHEDIESQRGSAPEVREVVVEADSATMSIGRTTVQFGRTRLGTTNARWTVSDVEGDWAFDAFLGDEPSRLAAVVETFIGPDLP